MIKNINNDSSPARKKGFIATTLAICSGTTIFRDLRKTSIFRMAAHLIALALLCSVANVMLGLYPFEAKYYSACQKLEKQFGGLRRSDKGMVPANTPDKPGTVFLDSFRVDYFPNDTDLDKFDPSDDFNVGIVWTPDIVARWTKISKNSFQVVPIIIPPPGENVEGLRAFMKKLTRIANRGKLAKSLRAWVIPPEDMMPWAESASFHEFKTNMLGGVWLDLPTIYGMNLFSGILVNALFISPLYILVFTAFSFVFGRSGTLGMNFKQLFVVGMYTGFPGMIIATIYTALDLPALDYQSVFLLSYLIYSFPVFSRLSRNVNGDGEGNP